jgi:hypothetical protein
VNTVLRLVYQYFTATRLHRVLTFGGLLAFLAALYVAMTMAQSQRILALAIPGQLALFLGSTMMPLIFGRLATQGGSGPRSGEASIRARKVARCCWTTP